MATDDPRPAGTRASGASRRRRVWKVVGLCLAVLLVAGAATAGYVAYRTMRAVSQITREPDALPTGSRPPSAVARTTTSPTPGSSATSQPPVTAAAPVNLLLIGSDKRNPDENGRSDTLVVAHISGDRRSVYFVSFPRDMWVAIPGHGTAKINAAYSWGGSSLAVATIEQLTQARIDHVAITDLTDFIGLVDVVGGVTVDNPVPYSGYVKQAGATYNWPAGPVTLDGTSALAFVRQRYELPRGDLDRALRQRALLKALALKIASPAVIANPVELTDVISAVSTFVTVDAGFTDSAILDLASSMRITSGDQISMLQAPITGFGTSADGQSIDVVDVAGVQALGVALRTDTMADYVARHPQ